MNRRKAGKAPTIIRVPERMLDPVPRAALPGTVLLVDGLFLYRDELVMAWDLSVFLDDPFIETAKRMAIRDGTNPDPERPSIYPCGQASASPSAPAPRMNEPTY